MPTEIWSSQDEEEEEEKEEEEVTLIKSRDPYLAGGGKNTHTRILERPSTQAFRHTTGEVIIQVV